MRRDGRTSAPERATSTALSCSPRSARRPSRIEYYGSDLVGSIRIVWDANGNVIGRQDFTPFGTPVQIVPPVPKEGFGGQERDEETGTASYFHARMLSASTGRFNSPDPIQAGITDPQRWNRYAYALNNPAVFSDVTGLLADACGDSAETDSNGVIHGSSACPTISMELWLFFFRP